MAKVYANYSIDFDSIDLNRIFSSLYGINFYDDNPFEKEGYSFQDELNYLYEDVDSGARGIVGLIGDFIDYDGSTHRMVGGVATGINDWTWDDASSHYLEQWGILGVSLSVVALQDAILTASVSDDHALLSAALSGHDSFLLSNGADRARGYDGNDEMYGYSGADLLYGGQGSDKLYGGAGNDTLDGGSGTDRLMGGSGNDVYRLVTSGDTVVEGSGAGTDTVKTGYSYSLGNNVEKLVLTGSNAINGSGNSLANHITGNSGTNTLSGGGGNDKLDGGSAGDALRGGSGNDQLDGGSGADRLYAGTGADKLNGGSGKDHLYGGTDSAGDDFIFTSRSHSKVGSSHDVIHNFTRSSDDIDLRRIDARPSSDIDNAFSWGGKAAADHSVWWKATADGVLLRGDVTGDARADFEVLLKGISAITSADVLL